jgi:hypothetical protein
MKEIRSGVLLNDGNDLRNFLRYLFVRCAKSRKKNLKLYLFAFFSFATVLSMALAPAAFTDGVIQLVPNTAVLLSNTGSSGNGGNTSSASSSTNIFSPASYVDYHQVGGEPTTVVDRYLFSATSFPSCGLGGLNTAAQNPVCLQQAACNSAATCYHDLVYVSNPVGLPTYSAFYKSPDGGQTFHIPLHNAQTNQPPSTVGGGDSHHAVGELTHSVFFLDLSGLCVTTNISRDLGETFSSNLLGCEGSPGAIDDRQWVSTDETAPGSTGGAVYINFNNDTFGFTIGTGPAGIVLVKSNNDGGTNTAADWGASSCNAFNALATASPADSAPTACPDPADNNLWIAGPVVVDKSPSSPRQHTVYIPFERFDGSNFQLYLAISTNEGTSWTRHKVLDIGLHDPANIFPQLTIDTAGNLYFTWAQAQTFNNSAPDAEGETDAYYTFSSGFATDGTPTWAAPINLTKEIGDSAVFPWMIAGSPGQVDIVMYKANSGLNPNIAFVDTNGNPNDSCSAAGPNCIPNTTVWNVYFGQSQNALNSGPNFKLVQISDHPIHIGGVCTQGTACQSGDQANRNLLDFLTVDVDHTGAACVTWADDNNGRHDTHQFFSRQLAGNSIFKGQNIAAMNSYPITDHSVTDPPGDVIDANGVPESIGTPVVSGCGGMDLQGASATRNNNLLTVTLTLAAPPTSTQATACSRAGATGGLWGMEFWAASVPNTPGQDNIFGNNNFYIAYRDNPGDVPDGATPGVEAGAMNAINATLTHYEFSRYITGSLGGTCLTSAGVVNPNAPTPCTITLNADLSLLGIKSGSILSAMSGFSVYYFGSETNPPGLRVPLGNSDLADIATPFDVLGTGTTTK